MSPDSLTWNERTKTRRSYEAQHGRYTLVVTQTDGAPPRWNVTAGPGMRGAEGSAGSVDEAKRRALRAADLLAELAEVVGS